MSPDNKEDRVRPGMVFRRAGFRRKREMPNVQLIRSNHLFCSRCLGRQPSCASSGDRTRQSPSSKVYHLTTCGTLISNHRRDEIHRLPLLAKAPLARQAPPGEQQSCRQTKSLGGRRDLPRKAIALRHDPQLLVHSPATPRPGCDNLKPRNRRHSRLISYTTMSQPPLLSPQGGPRLRHTAAVSASQKTALPPMKLAMFLSHASSV